MYEILLELTRMSRNPFPEFRFPARHFSTYMPGNRVASDCNSVSHTLQQRLAHTATASRTHCNSVSHTLQQRLTHTATASHSHCNSVSLTLQQHRGASATSGFLNIIGPRSPMGKSHIAHIASQSRDDKFAKCARKT